MKVGRNLLLTGILSITAGSLACYAAMAQDNATPDTTAEQPMWPAAITDQIAPDHGGVQSWGDIEAGGRYFIERPKDTGTTWTTPSIQRPDQQSIQKFEEYGEVPQGAYLERLSVGGQTKDAEYFTDLRATDIGLNNQRYIFDWGKTGEISGNVSWDQIPHIYSTSAQSIWQGGGTSVVTTNVRLGVLAGNGYGSTTGTLTCLTNCGTPLATYTGANYTPTLNVGGAGIPIYPTSPGQLAGGQTVSGLVDAALLANMHTTTVAIQRDKFETDNKWTPTPNWEFTGGYSNEHRDGTQIAGVVWGGPGAPERVDTLRPIDDTTQQARLTGERTGTWAYGQWNVKLTGGISDYNNAVPSFTVVNPYAQIVGTPVGANGCGSAYIGPQAPCAQLSNAPSNQAYTAAVTGALDLPWQSRWMNTVQYQSLQQNEAFQSMTSSTGKSFTSTGGVLAPTVFGATAGGGLNGLLRTVLPEASAHGDVEILTVNSVLNTQITQDLKSTLRYRYYDNDNLNSCEVVVLGLGRLHKLHRYPEQLRLLPHSAGRIRGLDLSYLEECHHRRLGRLGGDREG